MRYIVDLVRRVAGGDARRAVLTLIGGTGLSQLLLIAISPIVTRLYAPDDLGAFSVAVSIMALITSVASLSYHFAIALPDDDVVAANLLGLGVALGLGSILILSVGAYLGGNQLLDALGMSAVGPYVPLVVLGQGLATIAGAMLYWTIRSKAFSVVATNTMVQSGSVAVVQVALGLTHIGGQGLMAGTVAGFAATTAMLGRAAWRSSSHVFRSISPAGMLASARRYRRFAFLTTPSVLLNTLGLRLPLLIVVALFGPDAGGQFALADRVVGLPVTLVATAVGQVYYSQASVLAREHTSALEELFRRTTRSLALIAIVPAVLIALLAPWFFALIFGEAWRQAGVFVSLMVPWFYVILIANPTGSTLDVLERQDLNLVREGIRIGLLVAATVTTIVFELSADGCVAVLSAAGCVTYAIYGLMSRHAITSRRSPGEIASGPGGVRSDT